jgi:hypothetical protein
VYIFLKVVKDLSPFINIGEEFNKCEAQKNKKRFYGTTLPPLQDSNA